MTRKRPPRRARFLGETFQCFRQAAQRRLSTLEQQRPGIGRLDAAGTSAQQLGAELPLELGDAPADGRQGDAQCLGHAGKTALACDGAEELEIIQAGFLGRHLD